MICIVSATLTRYVFDIVVINAQQPNARDCIEEEHKILYLKGYAVSRKLKNTEVVATKNEYFIQVQIDTSTDY